jgi:hypothetical protein
MRDFRSIIISKNIFRKELSGEREENPHYITYILGTNIEFTGIGIKNESGIMGGYFQ